MPTAAALNPPSTIRPPPFASNPALPMMPNPSPTLAATGLNRPAPIAKAQTTPVLSLSPILPTTAAGLNTPDLLVFVRSESSNHSNPSVVVLRFGVWFLYRRPRRRWCFVDLSPRLIHIRNTPQPNIAAADLGMAKRYQTKQARSEPVRREPNRPDSSRPGRNRAEPPARSQTAGLLCQAVQPSHPGSQAVFGSQLRCDKELVFTMYFLVDEGMNPVIRQHG